MTHEQRYDRTPDGTVWTPTEGVYALWSRYLAVFDRVAVLARVRDVPSVAPNFKRADGDRVAFVAVPHYLGPAQYLGRVARIRATIRNAVVQPKAVMLRAPGQISFCAESLIRGTGRPYGVEVMGDPRDVFAPGAVEHPLRPYFRWWFTRRLRRVCAGAAAAAYVTERTLQQRYPCNAYAAGVSDVDLPPAAFLDRYRQRAIDQSRKTRTVLSNSKCAGGDRGFTIVTVGSLAQLYKAPDVLIESAAECVRDGLDVRLVFVGDGRHRSDLERLATKRGLADRISFPGHVPAGEAVQAQLDRADLFALPSRADGLPRAMIEAMARGLPCIGSTVGGIPELLPPEDLVPPGNVSALTSKIREVVEDPARRDRMSRRNFEKAAAYRDDIVRARRTEFYEELRSTTAKWLQNAGRPDRRASNRSDPRAE